MDSERQKRNRVVIQNRINEGYDRFVIKEHITLRNHFVNIHCDKNESDRKKLKKIIETEARRYPILKSPKQALNAFTMLSQFDNIFSINLTQIILSRFIRLMENKKLTLLLLIHKHRDKKLMTRELFSEAKKYGFGHYPDFDKTLDKLCPNRRGRQKNQLVFSDEDIPRKTKHGRCFRINYDFLRSFLFEEVLPDELFKDLGKENEDYLKKEIKNNFGSDIDLQKFLDHLGDILLTNEWKEDKK